MTDRRDQLAEALEPWAGNRDAPLARSVADALLPVVDRLIREAQADALDDVAAVGVNLSGGVVPALWLRDRAAALRSQP